MDRLSKRDLFKPKRAGGNKAELQALMSSGRWREAITMAARFQTLGIHKERILRAREAYQRPDFQRELGKDPEALILDGVEALKAGWGDGLSF